MRTGELTCRASVFWKVALSSNGCGNGLVLVNTKKANANRSVASMRPALNELISRRFT